MHIPGANGRGTNYVVTEDRIYIAAGDKCYVLDSTSGEKVLTIHLPNPKADDDEAVGRIGDTRMGLSWCLQGCVNWWFGICQLQRSNGFSL